MTLSTQVWRRGLPALPARTGLGLKPQHCDEILESSPEVGFFEVHAENYMGAGGPPTAISNGSARNIHCPCTASDFRSAASNLSTGCTSPA